MTKVLEKPPSSARLDDGHSTHEAGHTHEPTIRNFPKLTNKAINELVQICKLLGDDTRMRILIALTEQPEIHVRALCDMLGQTQPAVSHHLNQLRAAGLIERRHEGKHNYYRALPDRVHQVLDVVFAGVPEPNRRIRLDNYLLSFAPPVA